MSRLEIESLRKEFRVPGGREVAVNNFNLTLENNEFFTLVGPSGCGKTTTMRCIAGLETPTSGKISIDGKDLADVPSNKRNIAMMFQSIALYPHMTVSENIAYPLKVTHVPTEERRRQVEEAAEIVGIGGLLDKYPGEVSGGQQQRAAIARTLVQNPDLFLMDEPLSDLDAQLKVHMRKEIQRIHKRVKKPFFYVTHDQEEALSMSDRIGIMDQGKLIQVGTPDELYDQPKTAFVGQFMGSPSMNQLEGIVQTRNGKTTIEIGGDGGFSINYDEESIEDGNILVGIRPESIQLSSQGDYSGRILLKERIGDRSLLIIDGPGGEELRLTAPADTSSQEGDEAQISMSPTDILLFDYESGERIAPRAANTA